MNKPIKIGIVDDHPVVLEGLQNTINQNGFTQVNWTTKSGNECIQLCKQNPPDVLLLDIQLKDISGIEVCKVLGAESKIAIIGFSSHQDLGTIKVMLKNGAKGYLSKTCEPEELFNAIELVVKGEVYLGQYIRTQLSNESLGIKNKGNIRLTKREQQILDLIADEFTSAAIADQLCLSPKTVESHRLNLMHKFEVKNAVGLIKQAIEKGFI